MRTSLMHASSYWITVSIFDGESIKSLPVTLSHPNNADRPLSIANQLPGSMISLLTLAVNPSIVATGMVFAF